MCQRVKCFMCLRKSVSGVGVQGTHVAPSQQWIVILLRHLIFHEWNYGVDSSLSWVHAFQTNLFVILNLLCTFKKAQILKNLYKIATNYSTQIQESLWDHDRISKVLCALSFVGGIDVPCWWGVSLLGVYLPLCSGGAGRLGLLSMYLPPFIRLSQC